MLQPGRHDMSENLDPRFELRIRRCDGVPPFVVVFKLEAVSINPRYAASEAATVSDPVIQGRASTNHVESVDVDPVGEQFSCRAVELCVG